MSLIILFLTSTLSILLPDGNILNEKAIREKNINLPYGVLPLYERENGINLSLYSVLDTINYTQVSPIAQYQKEEWGFVFAPVFRYGSEDIYPTEKKFGIYADVIRGSIFYKKKNILLSMGKDIFSIGGSFEHNPVLSPNIPLNYVQFIYTNDNFSFLHLISRLSDYTGIENEWADSSSGMEATFQRYLGIHRLEFKPNKSIGISFSEIMLIGGESSGFPFELLSPLTLYYAEQFNQAKNVNILWNLDAKAIWGNFLFSLDFFIDDFQYESDPWKEPNHIGIYTGIQGINLIKEGSHLTIAYNLLTRWTYCNFRVWQRYIEKDFPLGSPLGNDYDYSLLRFTYPLSSFDAGMEFSFLRKGEGSMTTPWPVNPGQEASPDNQFEGTNFLSGIIEKTSRVSVIFGYKSLVNIKAGISYIRNYHHKEGEKKTEPILQLRINCQI